MRLRTLTYNIHKGFNWNNSELTISKIREVIHQTHAEIVFLQEVVGENSKHQKEYDEWINAQYEFLAEEKWPEFAYAKNAIYDHRHHGNAILSKYPITKWEQVDISTNKYEQRGVLFCEIELPSGPLHAYCVHLNLLHRERVKQYVHLSEIIKERTPNEVPVIVAGDFNDWNRKASSYLEEMDGFHEAHKSLHGQYPKTFPIQYPILSLDRMYVRQFKPEFTCIHNNGLWKELSDHAAIYVEGII
jgi:endonuclease/exonuclease/phosphatase family metal-dependent hydrolase